MDRNRFRTPTTDTKLKDAILSTDATSATSQRNLSERSQGKNGFEIDGGMIDILCFHTGDNNVCREMNNSLKRFAIDRVK